MCLGQNPFPQPTFTSPRAAHISRIHARGHRHLGPTRQPHIAVSRKRTRRRRVGSTSQFLHACSLLCRWDPLVSSIVVPESESQQTRVMGQRRARPASIRNEIPDKSWVVGGDCDSQPEYKIHARAPLVVDGRRERNQSPRVGLGSTAGVLLCGRRRGVEGGPRRATGEP